MNRWLISAILFLCLSLTIYCNEIFLQADRKLLEENIFTSIDLTNEAQFLKMFSKVLFIILVIILYE